MTEPGDRALRTRSTTLRGTGWLRESPRNLVPLEWLAVRGRSQLRKCLFLPALREGQKNLPAPDPAIKALDADTYRERDEAWKARTPRRPDSMRHARLFPASPLHRDEPLTPRKAWGGGHDQEAERRHARKLAKRAQLERDTALSSPVVLGLLLIALPPVGLAAVWSSPRYDRDARWALTFTSALFMALATIALLSLAR